MLTLALMFLCVLHVSQGCEMPKFNFTISSSQNETGHWFSQIQFHHEDNLPWDIDVEHKNVIWKGKPSILIDAKIGAPLLGSECDIHDYSKVIKNGYTLLPDYGYYKVHMERTTWLDAMDICQKEGAHLLIVNSDDEAHKVAAFANFDRFMGKDCWTGIHDQFKEGHYVTIFSEPLNSTGFTKWDDDEPDSDDLQDCFDFTYMENNRYGLGDYECNLVDEFICEKELY